MGMSEAPLRAGGMADRGRPPMGALAAGAGVGLGAALTIAGLGAAGLGAAGLGAAGLATAATGLGAGLGAAGAA